MGPRWMSRLPTRGRSPRIYLHIGAMKTGTTYLQALMSANRDELLAAGFLFPGERWADQSNAVRDILFSIDDPRVQAETAGKWNALRDEMMAYDGKASVVSMEFLSFADAERAAQVVGSLEGAEVHIILTVRDATSAIPAQWQTGCRNGSKVPYQKFVRGARYTLNGEEAPKGRSSRMFQRTQGIPRMLEVWAPLVGNNRMHVITVPPRDADPLLLWKRFAKVVGVSHKVAKNPTSDSNPSLGLASSELLRRINIELGTVPQSDYNRVVKGALARGILSARAKEEPPVRLNRRGQNLARQWNQVVRDAIVESKVRVVGSLDELPTGPADPDAPDELPAATPEEILAAAATGRDGLRRLLKRFGNKTAALASGSSDQVEESMLVREALEDARSAEDREATSPHRWDDEPEPVDAAVNELTGLVRQCIDLNSQLMKASSGS